MNLAADLEAELRALLPRTITRGEDGRYYATAEGAAILNAWLRAKGAPLRVVVDAGKFRLVSSDR